MASDERLSSVTRSTEIENKVLIFQNIEIDIDPKLDRQSKEINPLFIYLR